MIMLNGDRDKLHPAFYIKKELMICKDLFHPVCYYKLSNQM